MPAGVLHDDSGEEDVCFSRLYSFNCNPHQVLRSSLFLFFCSLRMARMKSEVEDAESFLSAREREDDADDASDGRSLSERGRGRESASTARPCSGSQTLTRRFRRKVQPAQRTVTELPVMLTRGHSLCNLFR